MAPIIEAVFSTVGWTILGVLLFYGGVRFYDLLDPIDYQAEIRRGNVAAGVLIGCVILSLAAIIIAVILS